jgi:type I restriction-modification system DNA methylase subunit
MTLDDLSKVYLLRVFVDIDREPPEVVTVYRTSRHQRRVLGKHGAAFGIERQGLRKDHDYNLSPSRYVSSDDVEPPLPLEEALVLLAQAEDARAEADAELNAVLVRLGFAGWQSNG